MEDISGLWESFSLTDKEEVPFDFGEAEEGDHYYLAARFMTNRVLNLESVVRTFTPLWRAERGFTARDLGTNIVVFIFENESDLERVVQLEPWSYDKHLVSFQRVEADTSITEMECRWCSFWVQIHNLPVRRMSHEYASALGKAVGVVEQVAEDEEERGREGCMRIRVKIDISKPLCRGRKATLTGGKEIWIPFKYERLPNFCYWCGMLTHGDRDCERWLRSKGTLRREEQQYGAWLRAVVDRPIRRVEVKVAGRSNIPRWGRGFERSPAVHSPVVPPYGGVAVPEVGESIMDFTKLKENLPQFSEFPKPSSNYAEQTVHEIDDTLQSPVNHVDSGDIIGSTNALNPPVNHVDIGDIKKSTEARVSQEEFQPNHSIPNMEPARGDGICLTQSQYQPSLGKENNKVQSRNILKDIGNNSPKTRLKHTRKQKVVGKSNVVPGGKENIKGGEELKGMHEVEVQGESRGGWKRISRDILIGVSTSTHPSLSGMKREGNWAETEHAGEGGSKKSRGEDSGRQDELDGDMAAAGSQRRRTP
jgi:hypothetical protein